MNLLFSDLQNLTSMRQDIKMTMGALKARMLAQLSDMQTLSGSMKVHQESMANILDQEIACLVELTVDELQGRLPSEDDYRADRKLAGLPKPAFLAAAE